MPPAHPSLYRSLGNARTLSGRDIYRPDTDRQNHFRQRLSETSWGIVSALSEHGLSDSLLSDTAAKLRIAKNDSQHYGDNRPGGVFNDGTPVVPDPRFSYWNLLEFGITGEGGLGEFVRITGIDRSIDYATLCGVIGLLLIDSAVDALESGDHFIAASDAMEAGNCVEEMVLDRSYRSILRRHRRDFARQGGLAAHRETNEYKALVLANWRTGQHKTMASCARWAMKQFPLKSQAVVLRWLSAANKPNSATQQAE